jgi:hypothetical protein
MHSEKSRYNSCTALAVGIQHKKHQLRMGRETTDIRCAVRIRKRLYHVFHLHELSKVVALEREGHIQTTCP